jgi:hypothetical protein
MTREHANNWFDNLRKLVQKALSCDHGEQQTTRMTVMTPIPQPRRPAAQRSEDQERPNILSLEEKLLNKIYKNEIIFSQKANIHLTTENVNPYSRLIIAVIDSNIASVRELLANNCPIINIKDEQYRTAIKFSKNLIITNLLKTQATKYLENLLEKESPDKDEILALCEAQANYNKTKANGIPLIDLIEDQELKNKIKKTFSSRKNSSTLAI